ncbi:MAG: FKBP-type peptidyl-prolyl cis-trans isomerase [Clostridia bacterium]|nr:FKBP-type peptidyl-prolyl cis-trans isomerase [Clostridia bacterium]
MTRLDDREIRLGDRVNLNYTAIFEKEEYDDDTDGGFFLTLGKNELGIPGFDEGLVGATPGDEIALDLVFPDDYDKEPEYAGKEVSFIVTVNYISAALPELTDEIVSTFTVYKTVEEYETGIFEAIRDVKLVGLLWQRVLDGAVVLQYPEKEYENYYTEYLDGYTSLAEGYGMTLSELVEEMGLTMDGFYQEADGVTKTYIKEDLVVYAIAEAQGITLTEEEYDAAVLDYYNASGSAYYVSAELMEQTLGRQILTQQFLSEKVLDFLCESADIQK